MTEKELLEMLEHSAKDIEIPESLSPESILEKCRALPQEAAQEEEKQDKENRGKKFWKNRRMMSGLCAAAVFMICCISIAGIERRKKADLSDAETSQAAAEAVMEEAVTMDEAAPGDGGAGETPEAASAGDAGETEAAPKRMDAGTLYTLAGSYDAVYERLKEQQTAWVEEDGAAFDTAGRGAMADAEASVQDLAAGPAASGSAANAAKDVPASSTERYSKTNVQTDGIDESDVIKTDGEYIYALRGSSVSIVRAGEDEMELMGTLAAETESGSGAACAMYVDGNTLVLMIQETKASLGEAAKKSGTDVYDMNYVDTETVTSVLTYDISDKKAPKLLGKVEQDGAYVTSRKDGAMVYLFTGKYLTDDYQDETSYVIPKVNGNPVSEDCIYLGRRGTRALVISSVSLRRPEAARDTVMLLDEGAQVYMGTDSLYLYSGSYQNGADTTEIAKFTMKGGYLNGAAAVSLKGSIQDTFAIHEKEGKLRVLTTDFSGNDWENCLFLLNEDLKMTGKLEHIAVGESIYAARYLDDVAYFITYRNTDPLFAVDLSDETQPKLLGELEITGFSEYLHFWGEDKLLGIGYETDPSSGSQTGLKLVMFDMSDPAKLKILGTKVLQGVASSPALYDYKAVLADAEENLIGFVTETYRNGAKYNYELFAWNGESFENLLSEDVKDGYDTGSYRGLYIGDRFYIAHPEVIRQYDRGSYEMRGKLTFEN